jgi:aminoglycoside/choline kinase family phosphotransferase
MFNALAGASPAVTASLYKQAIDLLVRFQKATWVPVAAQDPCACVGYSRRFSPDLLQWEIDHFTQWAFLDWAQARPMPSQSDFINRQAARIVAELAGSPYALAHRDFQSTNLMLPTADRMVLIDFQDALMAPPVYDLVSLLRDSYVQLPAPLLEELISYYWQQAAGYFPASNEEAFLRLFHLQTLQRKLKDAGRFVFIDRMKGNPSFLKWVEPTLGYVAHAFSSLPEYKGLREVLALYLPILR